MVGRGRASWGAKMAVGTPETGGGLEPAAWVEIPLLAAVPCGSGWLALKRRILVAPRRPGTGVVLPQSGRYSSDWLDYAGLALRCALRLGGAGLPGSPGADLLVARPADPGDPGRAAERALAGGSASFPIALALALVLALAPAAAAPPAVYASGCLAGEDGRLLPGRADVVGAKAALLEHLHPAGDYVFFVPPHGAEPRRGTTVVPDVRGALAVLGVRAGAPAAGGDARRRGIGT